jgi:hypothetical protein
MGPDFKKAIDEIRLQMRRLEAVQQNSPNLEGLTEQDIMYSCHYGLHNSIICSSISMLLRFYFALYKKKEK